MILDTALSKSLSFYLDLYYFFLLKRFHLEVGLHKSFSTENRCRMFSCPVTVFQCCWIWLEVGGNYFFWWESVAFSNRCHKHKCRNNNRMVSPWGWWGLCNGALQDWFILSRSSFLTAVLKFVWGGGGSITRFPNPAMCTPVQTGPWTECSQHSLCCTPTVHTFLQTPPPLNDSDPTVRLQGSNCFIESHTFPVCLLF